MLLFYIVWTVWLVFEVLLNLSVRSGKNDQKGHDKRSLWVIWVLIVIAITAASFVANTYQLPIGQSRIIQYAGLVVIVAGMVLRFVAIKTLGRFFTVDVTIRDNHQLKTDGLYRYVRHPSYLGSLISFAGLGFSINNWLSCIIIVTLVTAAFLYRIKIEEKSLGARFGDDYAIYKQKTRSLIPRVV
jgi:protein-S-isoprenylcysteine O-methyltransferase Ste14